jgi:Domain of Unknown Function with PDB structure (DUF3857)/Transglutaminase-like superfamily
VRKSTSLSVILFISILGSPCFGSTSVSVPDWLKQAAADKLPTYPAATKAVVLTDEIEDTVEGPGQYVEHYRRVVKILRPDGREHAQLRVHLHQQDKLLSVHAWSIDSAGHQFEVKDKEFEEVAPHAGEILYSDVRFKHTRAPAGEQPGTVIGFEYEVRYVNWLNQVSWVYQESIPVRRAQFTLQLPSDWEYKAAWSASKHPEAQRVADNRWTWTQADVQAIDDEEKMMPDPYGLAARGEFAYFGQNSGTAHGGSWENIGKWESDLAAGRRTPSPEIATKVHELTAGKNDFDSKARALADFVQTNTRYVAIEIGVGGYQPHPAADVYRFGYGDCKDKATLLSSMLQEAGIRSEYVLVETNRGVVHPEMPSPAFDHMILAIDLPPNAPLSKYQSVVQSKSGKQYLIFDPTSRYTPFGQLPAYAQENYILLVTAAGGELLHLPALDPATNVLERIGKFKLGTDGTLAGEIVEDRTGNHALRERHMLKSANEQQRSKYFEQFLNQSLKQFSLETPPLIEGLDTRDKLTVRYKLSTTSYAQNMGPLMLVRPRIVGDKQLGLDFVKPRQYPVELEASSRESDTYEIELPQGYAVDDIPDPVKIDVGFASYQSKTEVKGQTLRYHREYIVRSVEVSPDKFAELKNFEGMIGADERAAVVLKKSDSQ